MGDRGNRAEGGNGGGNRGGNNALNNNNVQLQTGVKRKATSYGTDSVETWAATEIEQETFSFLWTLKSYSTFTSNEEVKSPIFRGGPKSQHQWQIKISPKKKIEEIEYFAVHLILCGFGDADNTGTRKLKVRFQITLLDADGRSGKQAGSVNMNVCEFKRGSVWGYDKFITAADLVTSTRRLLDEDTLRIHCRIWIEGEIKHKTGPGGMLSPGLKLEDRVQRQKDKLSTDFSILLKSHEFTDVDLTAGKNTFKVHKAVLAARSKVFAAMFSTNLLESKKNLVQIPDFEEDIVEGMLEYMYTGQVTCLSEKASELLQIAEKYDLPGLKEECEHTMADNLSIDSAADILLLAHMYNATHLKPKVIDFINRNKDDVRKTEAFNRVARSNSSVFVELYLSQKN